MRHLLTGGGQLLQIASAYILAAHCPPEEAAAIAVLQVWCWVIGPCLALRTDIFVPQATVVPPRTWSAAVVLVVFVFMLGTTVFQWGGDLAAVVPFFHRRTSPEDHVVVALFALHLATYAISHLAAAHLVRDARLTSIALQRLVMGGGLLICSVVLLFTNSLLAALVALAPFSGPD